MKKASQLFDGITDATMLHGKGWHFYGMGRLIERADQTSRLLADQCIFDTFFALRPIGGSGTVSRPAQ